MWDLPGSGIELVFLALQGRLNHWTIREALVLLLRKEYILAKRCYTKWGDELTSLYIYVCVCVCVYVYNTVNKRLGRQALRYNSLNKISYLCSITMNLYTFKNIFKCFIFTIKYLKFCYSFSHFIASFFFFKCLFIYFLAMPNSIWDLSSPAWY